MRRLALAAALLTLSLSAVPATAAPEPVITQQVVTSFDGTRLFTTLFRPAGATRAPLVLKTHGWGGAGETGTTTDGLTDKLIAAGYAVLTWDSRGFGQSGGESHVDNPLYEGKDVTALIDWAVEAGVVILRKGDPVVGMAGGSYAGGIQTASASFDPRIDAITPQASWSDLRYALSPGGVIKLGWTSALYAAGNTTLTGGVVGATGPAGLQTGRYASDLDRSFLVGVSTNELDAESQAFLAGSSLHHYDGANRMLAVPTLVMQGSVDTLFNLTDGYGIYEHAKEAGAPAKFIAFCGGHVACPADYAAADDNGHIERAVLAWFAKHLRGQKVDTGAAVEYRTNADGAFRSADGFAPSNSTSLTGTVSGTVISTAAPETEAAAEPGFGTIATAVASRAEDPRALTGEVTRARRSLDLVGLPTAELEVSGTGRSVHLYVKLVHRETGHVLNLQEAPVRVDSLSSEPQRVHVTMPGIAYTLPAGHHLDVQVSTASTSYSNARVPAQVQLTAAVHVPSVPSGRASR